MPNESPEEREQRLEIRRVERAARARSVFPLFPELRGRTWLEFLREELSDEPSLSFDTGKSGPITVSIDVRSKRGHITVHLSAEKLKSYGNLWDRGVSAGELSSASLADTVAFLRTALARDTPVGTIQSEMPFFRAFESGLIQDKGRDAYLDYQWRELFRVLEENLEYFVFAQIYKLAQIASQTPKLRQLLPYTSVGRFCFSRCLGFPFSYDCPSAQAFGENYFQVYASNGMNEWDKNPIGFGNATEAAQMLVDALPPDCGPAVLGTADDLK